QPALPFGQRQRRRGNFADLRKDRGLYAPDRSERLRGLAAAAQRARVDRQRPRHPVDILGHILGLRLARFVKPRIDGVAERTRWSRMTDQIKRRQSTPRQYRCSIPAEYQRRKYVRNSPERARRLMGREISALLDRVG